MTETDILNALSKLRREHRDLSRTLGGAAHDISADIAAIRQRGKAELSAVAPAGMLAARNATQGVPAWKDVERMAIAYVLASPEFLEAVQTTLGVPDAATVAAKRAELDQVEERIAAHEAEMTARSEDAQRAYLDRARDSRAVGT